jgi:hypothetical protein
MVRFSALMMPVVIVWSKPNGLPIAIARLADLEVGRSAERQRLRGSSRLAAQAQHGDVVVRADATSTSALKLFADRDGELRCASRALAPRGSW